MEEMIKQCCGSDGRPDFAMMKNFMERCGKMDFSAAELEKMHQFCDCVGPPDMSRMKQFMESCGCCMTETVE